MKTNESSYFITYDDYIRKNRKKNPTEDARMTADIAAYGYYDSGTHYGVKWEMKRFRYQSGHWCGYVLYDGIISDEERKKVAEKSHYGLTSYLGFNCAHYYDYTMSYSRGTYRDHDYVVECLKDMCEVISQSAGFIPVG